MSWATLTGVMPRIEMRPWVGRRPAMPVSAAGMRTEPPVSVPRAASAMSAATAAPEPPLEPPGMRAGFQGLRHWPATGLVETTPHASSWRLALPIRIAPWAFSRAAAGASRLGMWSAR